MSLVIIVVLLVLFMACGRIISENKMGNLTFVDEETALDNLPDEARALVILVTNSSDRGIYWLDLDHHSLYMARKLHSNVPPEEKSMTWTGTQLVYGHRLDGFFSLASDGNHQQITAFNYRGQIARDGEQILRFRKCDPDETGDSYTITPLDRFTEPPLICLPRPSSGLGYWYYIHPIWNPYLAKVDFVVSKQTGQGQDRVFESKKMVQVLDNGELDEFMDLGPEFSLENPTLYFRPRPDGQAFYIHDKASSTGRIIDRQGRVLIDLAELDAQRPHLQRTGRFSWSPDGQKAVLVYEDCRQSGTACDDVLVLATNNFGELTELTSLPSTLRFNDMIWSPDSQYLGLVTEIHQGRDDPPRIYTIRLADQSLAEYVFPTRIILRSVQWIR